MKEESHNWFEHTLKAKTLKNVERSEIKKKKVIKFAMIYSGYK